MKKTILTSVLALAAIVAMPTFATAQTDDTGATEQTRKVKKDRMARHDSHQGMKKKSDAFEGITLTEAQKDAIKALQPQRPSRQDGKKEKPDSVGKRPDLGKVRADYVNGVKAILTPEQYVIFLENIVVNDAVIPGSRPMLRQHDMHKRAGKDNDKGKKGNLLRKGPKPQAKSE